MLQLLLNGARVAAARAMTAIPGIFAKQGTKIAASFAGFELLKWAFEHIFGSKDDDGGASIKEIRKEMEKRVPGTKWSSDNDVFERQLVDYAKRGEAEQALLMEVLTKIGYQLNMDDTTLEMLTTAAPAMRDGMLISFFNHGVQSLVGDRNPATRTSAKTTEGALLRVQLLKNAARRVGGAKALREIQAAILTLEEGDFELYERLQELN